MASTPQRWNWSARILAAVTVVGGLVVGAYAIAGASTPGSGASRAGVMAVAHGGFGGFGGLSGVVTKIDTSSPGSVTIQPPNGAKPVTVVTNSSTVYREACARTESSTLKVGDKVVVIPTLTAEPMARAAAAAVSAAVQPLVARTAVASAVPFTARVGGAGGAGGAGLGCWALERSPGSTTGGSSGGIAGTPVPGMFHPAFAGRAGSVRVGPAFAGGSGSLRFAPALARRVPLHGCPVPPGVSSVSGTGESPLWRMCCPVAVSGVTAVSGSGGGETCGPPPTTGPPVAAEIDIVLPVIAGTVQQASSGQFVVKDAQGFWRTVSTSGNPTYQSGGTTVTSAAVVSGAEVVAFGTVDADHTTLDAVSVFILGPTETGKVWSKHGDTVTLHLTGGKSLAVVVSSHTVYRAHGKQSSLGDLRTGQTVTVLGHSSHGGFQATEVRS